jgi:hypothetical protein
MNETWWESNEFTGLVNGNEWTTPTFCSSAKKLPKFQISHAQCVNHDNHYVKECVRYKLHTTILLYVRKF